jgi:gamma-glutamyltranspeptidase/glutathione hydrolase
VLDSGGSNRIRTAVLQVISNILAHGMAIKPAVRQPRMHYENHVLNIEAPQRQMDMDDLKDAAPETLYWGKPNLFFGGVHAVRYTPDHQTYDAVGDLRRIGHATVC